MTEMTFAEKMAAGKAAKRAELRKAGDETLKAARAKCGRHALTDLKPRKTLEDRANTKIQERSVRCRKCGVEAVINWSETKYVKKGRAQRVAA